MSTYTTTATIDCGRCKVPLQGPDDAQGSDLLTCPQCGGQVETQEAIRQAGDIFKAKAAADLREAFKRAGFK